MCDIKVKDRVSFKEMRERERERERGQEKMT